MTRGRLLTAWLAAAALTAAACGGSGSHQANRRGRPTRSTTRTTTVPTSAGTSTLAPTTAAPTTGPPAGTAARVSLVAWGGVGKTMLVQHWLRRLQRENWFGVIEIGIGAADFALLNADGTLRSPRYVLRFLNRSTRWRYIFPSAQSVGMSQA